MSAKISDHQQSWGYEDGPWKGPRPSLLVAADFYKSSQFIFMPDKVVLEDERNLEPRTLNP